MRSRYVFKGSILVEVREPRQGEASLVWHCRRRPAVSIHGFQIPGPQRPPAQYRWASVNVESRRWPSGCIGPVPRAGSKKRQHGGNHHHKSGQTATRLVGRRPSPEERGYRGKGQQGQTCRGSNREALCAEALDAIRADALSTYRAGVQQTTVGCETIQTLCQGRSPTDEAVTTGKLKPTEAVTPSPTGGNLMPRNIRRR